MALSLPLDLLFAGWLALASAGVGDRALRAFGRAPDHPVDRWGLATAIGLGLVALATLAVASAGWLDLRGVVALMALASAVGIGPGARSTLGAARRVREDVSGVGGSRADRVVLGAASMALAGSFLSGLVPVTDGDALCYHLQVPKVFLLGGGTAFDPDLHETIYPLSVEMLYALALGVRGPVACRLVHWLFGLVFAANAAAIARPSMGPRAWWAGAVALLCPAVSNGMAAPLNDVALAALGNAAVAAWLGWLDRPSWRSAAVAGLLVGLAAGVKYPALVLGGVLGAGFLVAGSKSSIRSRVGHAGVFALAALVAGGWWYLRAFEATGNPVFPFYRHVFGGAGLDEVLDPIKRPMAATPWNVLTALGPMTLDPARFDSFSHQFGPAFLAFLPPLLWSRPPRRLLVGVLVGYAFLTLCVTQRQSMRFVLIAVGPMSAGVAWMAARWLAEGSRASRALFGLFAACLVFEGALALARPRHALGVISGREPAGAYLDRAEPTHVVGRWIDANLPPSARVVGQDHRGFYIPRPYAMELAHRRRTGLGTRGESSDEVARRLALDGFDFVMFCPPVPEDAAEFDGTLGRLMAPWVAARRPVYRADLSDLDGVTRRYAIYRLPPAERGPR